MSTNFNVLDAAQQEKVRRGSHGFLPDPNRGGLLTYQPVPYKHQEYPKMMLTRSKPQFKQFKKDVLASQTDNELQALLLGQKLDMQSLYDAACQEWDEEARASIVYGKEQEEAWCAAHPEMDSTLAVTPSLKTRAKEVKAARDAQKEEHPVTHARKA